MNRFRIATGLVVGIAVVALSAVAAFAGTWHTPNWTTHTQGNKEVVCGIVPDVPGSVYSSGAMATVTGYYPGLQCDAEGLPKGNVNDGDRALDLGQGKAGKAQLIYMSQDNYGNSPFKRMPAHATWSKDGITCKISPASVSCSNGHGHSFTLSKGHYTLHN
jgi:hypothetical protein